MKKEKYIPRERNLVSTRKETECTQAALKPIQGRDDRLKNFPHDRNRREFRIGDSRRYALDVKEALGKAHDDGIPRDGGGDPILDQVHPGLGADPSAVRR